MSDASELAECVAEVVTDNPVTCYDQRGNSIVARQPLAIATDREMEAAGYFENTEHSLLVPAANLPATEPAEQEEILIGDTPFRIQSITRRAGVSHKYGLRPMTEATHTYYLHTDGTVATHSNGEAVTT